MFEEKERECVCVYALLKLMIERRFCKRIFFDFVWEKETIDMIVIDGMLFLMGLLFLRQGLGYEPQFNRTYGIRKISVTSEKLWAKM